MAEHKRGIPQKLLMRFAELLTRCEADSEDPLARKLLATFATQCRREFPELSEQALELLARDQDAAVRTETSSAVRRLLERLDGLERIRLVIDWATSAEHYQRVAIANALRGGQTIFGVWATLDQLSRDPRSEVRRAACAASARRLVDGADGFGRILRDGTRDPSQSVRTTAIAGLLTTAERKPHPEQSLQALDHCARSTCAGSARRARRALRQLSVCTSAEAQSPAHTPHARTATARRSGGVR